MHSNPRQIIIPSSHCPIVIPWLFHDRPNIAWIPRQFTQQVFFASSIRVIARRKGLKTGFWRHKWDIPGVGVMKCHFFKTFGLKKHVYDTWPNNFGISHKAWLFSWETLASWFPRYPVWMVLQCFIWFTSLAVAKPNQLFNIFNDVHGCSCRRYYGSPFVDSVSSLIFRWCFHHDGPVYRWFAY